MDPGYTVVPCTQLSKFSRPRINWHLLDTATAAPSHSHSLFHRRRHVILARGSAMVVVDEKTMLPPPPAYSLPRVHPNIPPVPESLHPPPFSAPYRTLAILSDLPSHLLLHIVHRTFPQAPDKSYNKLERQRKTLQWLTSSLRLVNRTFYVGMSLHFRLSSFIHTARPSTDVLF